MSPRVPLLIVSLVSWASLCPALARGGESFIIVQPGYPGTTEEAKGFVTDLARAIGEGGGPDRLDGVYYNSSPEALKAIGEKRPSFGIVSLGFFLEHRQDLQLHPILASKPLDRFYLAAKKGQPVGPMDLDGQAVEGTPFQEKEFVARVLFGPGAGGGPVSGASAAGGVPAGSAAGPAASFATGDNGGTSGGTKAAGKPLADVSKWKVEPTGSFSKAVRDVARGKARAVLLTGFEKRAMKDLTAGKDLEVHFQTEEYPTALVVSFDAESTVAKGSARALENLQGSTGGKKLLKTMGIEGFAPADAKRLAAIEERYAAGGKDARAGEGR